MKMAPPGLHGWTVGSPPVDLCVCARVCVRVCVRACTCLVQDRVHSKAAKRRPQLQAVLQCCRTIHGNIDEDHRGALERAVGRADKLHKGLELLARCADCMPVKTADASETMPRGQSDPDVCQAGWGGKPGAGVWVSCLPCPSCLWYWSWPRQTWLRRIDCNNTLPTQTYQCPSKEWKAITDRSRSAMTATRALLRW